MFTLSGIVFFASIPVLLILLIRYFVKKKQTGSASLKPVAICLIVLIASFIAVVVLSPKKQESEEQKEEQKHETESQIVAEESVTPTEAPQQENNQNLDFADESDGTLLDGINITASEMKEIYDEYEKAWLTYPEDVEEGIKYEEEVSSRIAEEHGLTPDQADKVYYYVATYGVPNTQKSFNLLYGDLLDVNTNGTKVIIKAKIKSSYSNEATVDQNYYNVCDIIRNQGGDKYDEIQYWAVADMMDGSESKVVAFTVPKNVIDTIATNDFPDNKLGDYVDDLFILPSLKQ